MNNNDDGLIVPHDSVSHRHLEDLEKTGLVARTGLEFVADDGHVYPCYVEVPLEKRLQAFQTAFDSLERRGILVKTGHYRPGSDGQLEPVYTLARYASKFMPKNDA